MSVLGTGVESFRGGVFVTLSLFYRGVVSFPALSPLGPFRRSGVYLENRNDNCNVLCMAIEQEW